MLAVSRPAFSKQIRLVWLVIAFGTMLRLYGITLPMVESHQLRQAQTAMMARNLYEDGMNISCTRLDFFGADDRCVIMEFPLMHSVVALLYHVFGVQEIIGRLVNILFSIGAMLMMYALARRFLSERAALFALLLYALSPMNIFFSRAFMPESSMMFFSLSAVYFALRWLESRSWILYVAAAASMAAAFLTKPTAGLALAPVLAAAWLDPKQAARRPSFWIYLCLAILPGAAWGVYASLVNRQNPDLPQAFGGWIQILFDRGGIFSHWVDPSFYGFLGGSIGALLLTPLGLALAVFGAWALPAGALKRILLFWLAAIVAYFFVLAGANRGHVYYHLHLLPVAAIFFGYGLEKWLDRGGVTLRAKPSAVWAAALMVAAAHLGGYVWFYRYMYDPSLRMPHSLEVADIIKARVAPKRLLAAFEPGLAAPIVLAYYSEANAWRFKFDTDEQAIAELERLRGLGATTYVALDTRYGNGVAQTRDLQKFWRHLNSRYEPIAVAQHYLIYDLKGKASL